MNKIIKFTSSLVIVGFLASCSGNHSGNEASNGGTNATVEVPSTQGIHHISNQQLEALLKKGVTLIDIRRPDEWAQTGTIAGSKRITFFLGNGQVNNNLVPQLLAAAPKDKPVILICRTGNRSRYASDMITKQLGYQLVYNVKKGITSWIAKGYPVSK